jgi:hypothetical protein
MHALTVAPRRTLPSILGSVVASMAALARHLQRNSKLVRPYSGRPHRAPKRCSNVRAGFFLRHVFQLSDVVCRPAAECWIGHVLISKKVHIENVKMLRLTKSSPSAAGPELMHGTIPDMTEVASVIFQWM